MCEDNKWDEQKIYTWYMIMAPRNIVTRYALLFFLNTVHHDSGRAPDAQSCIGLPYQCLQQHRLGSEVQEHKYVEKQRPLTAALLVLLRMIVPPSKKNTINTPITMNKTDKL